MPSSPQLTPDAQVSSAGVVIEGFCDASFAPNSGRSQQAIMVFVLGGLVAWTSSRQAFVTMSTAESELVAICELATCMKSVEQLVAEVMLFSKDRAPEVVKAICSDSQAALSVCRCAAGSWRTRHLRIRGNMIRELLEFPDWMVYHVEGRLMLADLGTKALPADRFGFLVDRMRVLRRRHTETTRTTTSNQAKKLIILLCLASVVERAEAAEVEDRESHGLRVHGALCGCSGGSVGVLQDSPDVPQAVLQKYGRESAGRGAWRVNEPRQAHGSDELRLTW